MTTGEALAVTTTGERITTPKAGESITIMRAGEDITPMAAAAAGEDRATIIASFAEPAFERRAVRFRLKN